MSNRSVERCRTGRDCTMRQADTRSRKGKKSLSPFGSNSRTAEQPNNRAEKLEGRYYACSLFKFASPLCWASFVRIANLRASSLG